MRSGLPVDRRLLLTCLAGALASPGQARAEKQASLYVAGPAGGRLDRWAQLLCQSVGRGLPARSPLLRQNVGGLDGVTGANQFEARGEPDGSAVLLVPGAALLSWLVGEARARFDPARWVPLWAGAASGVLVSRAMLEPGRTLRVAATGPTGSELPFLLALDLLGVKVVLSPTQEADAVLLQGLFLPPALLDSTAQGMNPVMTLGAPGPDGTIARDPLLPTIPTVVELVRDHGPATMLAVAQATSVAVLLDESLVLPQLTPAASVSNWRRACSPVLNDAAVLDEAGRLSTRQLSPASAAHCMGQLGGDPAMLLSLREWLAVRYDWRPA